MIGKHFTETLNKVELRINRVRINHARPIYSYIEIIVQVSILNITQVLS